MELELKPPGVFARFNREDLKPLYDLALKVEEDATQYKSMNTRLAGNIKSKLFLILIIKILYLLY